MSVGLTVLAQVQIRKRTATCESTNGFCPSWIRGHLGDYVDPFVRHLELTLVSVVAGFLVAFAVAIAAHRRHWLIAPFTAATGVLYTIPSLALFALLLPLTGFGFLPGVVALTGYNLLVIFRNVVAGLDNVPADAKDAARGMGLTDRQMLWRVEVPLAMPEIVAGVRIATVTTVGLASLAFIAGSGGLGQQLIADQNFKSNIVVVGVLCVAMAIALDALILLGQRIALPWKRAAA